MLRITIVTDPDPGVTSPRDKVPAAFVPLAKLTNTLDVDATYELVRVNVYADPAAVDKLSDVTTPTTLFNVAAPDDAVAVPFETVRGDAVDPERSMLPDPPIVTVLFVFNPSD